MLPSINSLRLEAAVEGLTQFDPLRPCSKGHEASRLTSSGQCCECNRIKVKRRQKAKQELLRTLLDQAAQRDGLSLASP